MMNVTLHYFKEDTKEAERLSAKLQVKSYLIKVHDFPDGECKIQISPSTGTCIVYASLDHPSGKLFRLSLAASALRDSGALRLVLVSPYLCYMRQDIAFNPGEAVSQRVLAEYLDKLFERLVTVDPHLHRTADLQEIFPTCDVTVLSAKKVIADLLALHPNKKEVILIGPDEESRQWVLTLAGLTGLPFAIGQKERGGDRLVHIVFKKDMLKGYSKAFIVDDIASSGMTLINTAKALGQLGVEEVYVAVTHAMCSEEDLTAILSSNIKALYSTDSVSHRTNSVSISSILAEALNEELFK